MEADGRRMRPLRDVLVCHGSREVGVRREPLLVALVLRRALRLEEDVPREGELVLPLRERGVLRLEDNPAPRLGVALADDGPAGNRRGGKGRCAAELRELVDSDLRLLARRRRIFVGTRNRLLLRRGKRNCGRKRNRRHHHKLLVHRFVPFFGYKSLRV